MLELKELVLPVQSKLDVTRVHVNDSLSLISDVTSSVYSSIQCPTVSNYELYGETNILRCNITGPFLKTSALECKATLIQCSKEM